MLAFANCLALFLSGAVLGACIDHWAWDGEANFTFLTASVLIAVIASVNMRRIFSSSERANGR